MVFVQLLLTVALAALSIAILGFILFWVTWIYYFTYYVVPYIPTRRSILSSAIKYAKGSSATRTFLDIGAGDGSVVIAAARAGFNATGIEANPLLVYVARWRIRRAGLSNKARMIHGDFFTVMFPPADVVYLFLVPQIVAKLAPKIRKEMPAGATVIVHSFPFPDWQPVHTDDKLLIYRVEKPSVSARRESRDHQ